jgi:hypothetical protein
MNKREAAALLHISPRTLERRMKAGVYQFSRAGEGQFAEVSFSYADIGLSEPAPPAVPVPLEVSHPAPRPEPVYDYPTAQEQFIIWVEGPDGKEVGFSGDVDGKTADQRAQKYRQQLAAQRRF